MSREMTIKDVAKKAGVSVSTVSRVFNGLDRVSESTRLKIQKVIEESNYVPNNVAVSMVSKQTKMIVVIVPDIIIDFFVSVVQGVEEVAKRHGYFTIVFSTNGNVNEEKEFLNGRFGKSVDGVISVPSSSNVDFYRDFPRPVVLVDRYVKGLGLDYVAINNFDGAYMATKHLLEYGHRKIAIINGPVSVNVGQDRYSGFMHALEESGVRVPGEYVKFGNWYEKDGYEYVRSLLALKDPPTAIFAANSQICIGAIKALHDMDVKIGEEISLIGFDENELAKFVRPNISVVGRPTSEMGQIAANILLENIKSKKRPPHQYNEIVLPTRLILRSSVKKLTD